MLADAKEEPKSDKSQNVKSPEEKPVDVQMRDDLLEEDPGTPVVDEPMETALPAAPQPTESAAEELVKSEQIESGQKAFTSLLLFLCDPHAVTSKPHVLRKKWLHPE